MMGLILPVPRLFQTDQPLDQPKGKPSEATFKPLRETVDPYAKQSIGYIGMVEGSK